MSTRNLTAKRRLDSPCFRAPAIERCRSYEAMLADAECGSQMLLRAIERAGVRP